MSSIHPAAGLPHFLWPFTIPCVSCDMAKEIQLSSCNVRAERQFCPCLIQHPVICLVTSPRYRWLALKSPSLWVRLFLASCQKCLKLDHNILPQRRSDAVDVGAYTCTIVVLKEWLLRRSEMTLLLTGLKPKDLALAVVLSRIKPTPCSLFPVSFQDYTTVYPSLGVNLPYSNHHVSDMPSSLMPSAFFYTYCDNFQLAWI
jgi:hypothetical protein